MKTAKETIIFVKEKLLEQRCMSINDNGSCGYRGAEGRKCAIGMLILDELYKPEWDEIGVSMSFAHGRRQEILDAVGKAGFCTDLPLLQSLQDIHDSCCVESWAERFDELAAKF